MTGRRAKGVGLARAWARGQGWEIKELREHVNGLKTRYDTAIQEAARAMPQEPLQDWTLD